MSNVVWPPPPPRVQPGEYPRPDDEWEELYSIELYDAHTTAQHSFHFFMASEIDGTKTGNVVSTRENYRRMATILDGWSRYLETCMLDKHPGETEAASHSAEPHRTSDSDVNAAATELAEADPQRETQRERDPAISCITQTSLPMDRAKLEEPGIGLANEHVGNCQKVYHRVRLIQMLLGSTF